MLVFVSISDLGTKKNIGVVLVKCEDRGVDIQSFQAGESEAETLEVGKFYTKEQMIELGYESVKI